MSRVTTHIAAVLLAVSPLIAGHRVVTPAETSICKIMESPFRFNGRIVRVRGDILWGLEDLDIYQDCSPEYRGGMVIQFPGDHPELKPGFHLIRDSAYEKFHYYLTAEPRVKLNPPPNVGTPTVPHRYCSMTVTVAGRFYAVSEQDAQHGRGYGNAGSARFALVVRSVSNPVAKECPAPSQR